MGDSVKVDDLRKGQFFSTFQLLWNWCRVGELVDKHPVCKCCFANHWEEEIVILTRRKGSVGNLGPCVNWQTTSHPLVTNCSQGTVDRLQIQVAERAVRSYSWKMHQGESQRSVGKVLSDIIHELIPVSDHNTEQYWYSRTTPSPTTILNSNTTTSAGPGQSVNWYYPWAALTIRYSSLHLE